MPVPDYQSLMLPTLEAFADGAELSLSRVRARVADAVKLSDEDRHEMLPSGRQKVFVSRAGWAITYMARAGLLERVGRGVYRLTQEGKNLLDRKPSQINLKLLDEYPAFARWRDETKLSRPKRQSGGGGSDTPEEALDRAAQQVTDELEAEVLSRVRGATPAFLEQAVVDLLIAMGYGGGDATMGRVTGGPGDGGIDGTVWEDALGLDEVCVQAKKYAEDKTVGARELLNFAGAIDAAGTTKGVFVTTASFTNAAEDVVAKSQKRIVLIDGPELARLMVRHGIGVRTRATHRIKGIDEDYFEQESL